jgi:asparagine synthase (glutamine-hydrolysing)
MTSESENISLKILQAMFETWLYSNCIALGDRMSMAHSIEMRLPLVDAGLVETVIGLKKGHPEEPKLPHKKWFIEAIKDLLPAEVFNRPKRGFTPPTQIWIKEIIKHYQKYLINGFLVKENLFDQSKTLQFLEKAKDPVALHFGYKLILLELWGRMYVMGQKYQDFI